MKETAPPAAKVNNKKATSAKKQRERKKMAKKTADGCGPQVLYTYGGRDYVIPAGMSNRASVNYVLALRAREQGTGARVHSDGDSSSDEDTEYQRVVEQYQSTHRILYL